MKIVCNDSHCAEVQADHRSQLISYHFDSFALFACFNSHEKNDMFHTLMLLYSALAL